MDPSLQHILEHAPAAVLLAQVDGTVLAANEQARLLTGLAPGCQVFDATLLAALQQSQARRQAVDAAWPRSADTLAGEPSCRVMPGPVADQAYIVLAERVGADPLDAGPLLPLVRSDLLGPLRRAHAALRLVRESGDDLAADALGDELDGLLQALDKVVDLATVPQARASMAAERVQLWPLLQQAWAEVEPLALARGVQVRFLVPADPLALPTMFGSQAWLHRLFTECLEAGLRACAPGQMLDIEHVQAGTRAMVVFRDCAMFRHALGAKDRAASAREQIAHLLCVQIARMHGGQLRSEGDHGSCDLLIDMPTGAPHGRDESHLAVAQAARFAEEREKLLARAEKRRAAADNTTRAAAAAVPAPLAPTGVSS